VTRATIAILTMLMAGGAGAQQTLCPGDCAVDGEVQVTDVVIMINVINGSRPIDDCRAGDFDDDARIRANDVTRAVRSILDGCSPGAIGQAAFYRALNGVPDTAEAQAAEEARAAANLTAAVAADVNDGWSWFLLGMYHLLQVGRELTDYDHPAPGVVDEARLAREALDQAVPLLAYDNRIPGFRGAATYNLGVLSDEPLRGKPFVLNIFPSVDTAVCAASVRTFNERAAASGVVVVNVSKDLPFAQKRFCGAEGIENVTTASAFRDGFGDDYGVTLVDGPMKGLLARAVVVVGANGDVVYTELVPEIAADAPPVLDKRTKA